MGENWEGWDKVAIYSDLFQFFLNSSLFLFPLHPLRLLIINWHHSIICLLMENFTIAIALMQLNGISIGS